MAMQFHSLTTSALNGTYHEVDATFFSEIDDKSRSRRLRAVAHQLNSSFAEYNAAKWAEEEDPQESVSRRLI